MLHQVSKKLELTVTPDDIAEVERLIIAVGKHNEEMEKWIREG